MSLKIEDYLNSISALSTAAVQGTTALADTAKTESADRDSYIASGADSASVLPCENYNDILKVMQSAKADASGTSASSGDSEASVSGVSSGGSGGGGSSDEEDETTTKVVVVNGVTYLETTTVTDGITTVKRTAIG